MKQNYTMENKLRSKEEAEKPDLAHVDRHWQEMRSLLSAPAYPVKKSIRGKMLLGSVLAGLFILGGLVFLLKYENGKTNTGNSVSQKEFPKIKADPKEPLQNPVTVVRQTVTNITKPLYNASSKKEKINNAGNLPTSYPATTDQKMITVPEKKQNISDLNAIQTTDEEKNKQLLLQFFNTVEKPSQQFVINNYKDTNLVCMQGTRVFIPANVFVYTNNTAVSSAITIEIKEFYSYQDIVSSKLSTTSDGGQLVSGGMLYIAAKQNGKEVVLANTKKMFIKMPATDYDEQMQLFTGQKQTAGAGNSGTDYAYDYNNDNINWKPAGQFQGLKRSRFMIKTFDPYGQPYQTIEKNNGTIVGKFIIKRNCPMSNADVLKGLKGHFELFYDKIKLRRSWSNRPGRLFSRSKWPIVGDSVMMEYTTAKRLKLVSKIDMEKYEKQLLKDSIQWNERVKSIPFYEFEISKMGFMNCDRFQNNTDPKVEFTLNLGEEENAANFFSVLAFDNYRSVMQGYCGKNKLLFSGIPKYSNVHLVCVGVKNGKVLSCIKSMQVGTEEVKGLKFEETTPEKFMAQLAVLHLK